MVLDDLVPRVERLLGKSPDERIAKRCGELRRAYRGRLLDESREPVDYSKPTSQIAYVYRTLPAHADWVFEALKTVPLSVQQLLRRGSLKVACIGGGPGTDMLGGVKYAETFGYPKGGINFTVLDREAGWNTPRKSLASTFPPDVVQVYQSLDLVEADNWT
ncbi:MAG TPA: hypothetical protein VGR19_11155 [Allosphingosinicella sp.]|nr:hypothetical protein [Allosphingosinicella sp.]